jgi:hypothetical protein
VRIGLKRIFLAENEMIGYGGKQDENQEHIFGTD